MRGVGIRSLTSRPLKPHSTMVVAQTPAHLEAVQQASLYYSTSLIAILFWDYLNTLPLEIGLVWKPLFSKNQREQFSESSWEKRIFLILSPLLFFILRYVCLVEFAAFLWSQHTRIPASTCDHWQRESSQSNFPASRLEAAIEITLLFFNRFFSRRLCTRCFECQCDHGFSCHRTLG